MVCISSFSPHNICRLKMENHLKHLFWFLLWKQSAFENFDFPNSESFKRMKKIIIVSFNFQTETTIIFNWILFSFCSARSTFENSFLAECLSIAWRLKRWKLLIFWLLKWSKKLLNPIWWNIIYWNYYG